MKTATRPSTEVSAGYAANMEGVAAVERALAIVEAIEQAEQPLTLTAVSEATGLYKSAVLRMMVTLERRGLVLRRQDQRYALGPLAFRLGRAYARSNHIEEQLAPLMQDLVARGTESPSFHVRHDGDTRLCLLRFDSHHSTLDRVRAGDLLPLKRGAAGKVLLRFGAGDTKEAGSELAEYSFGERDPACGAVAGPVFGPGGELVGALSLSGPLDRFTEAAVKKMVKPLLEACEAATRSLGGVWPEERSARSPAKRAIKA
ncbi:MAG: helix-turn-helix domain-containing protein [Rhizobacter sp.]